MNGQELRRMIAVHQCTARAYGDPRLAVPAGPGSRHSMREVIVTALWVAGWEQPEDGQWERIIALLDLTPQRLWQVIAADAPRWAPAGGLPACEARTSRKPACGARASWSFPVTDPADGTWRLAGFCTRHDSQGRDVYNAEQALRASGTLIPVPVPNRGGLFPCYLSGDWELLYRQASPGWTAPPAGICADTWHLANAAARPRLAVIPGGGLIDDASRLAPPPELVLVTAPASHSLTGLPPGH